MCGRVCGVRWQSMWTKDTLPQIFKLVGFELVLHEYFDVAGHFHYNKVLLLQAAPRARTHARMHRLTRCVVELTCARAACTRLPLTAALVPEQQTHVLASS